MLPVLVPAAGCRRTGQRVLLPVKIQPKLWRTLLLLSSDKWMTPCNGSNLARATGVQSTKKKELASPEALSASEISLLECGTKEVQNVDDSSNQSNDLT